MARMERQSHLFLLVPGTAIIAFILMGTSPSGSGPCGTATDTGAVALDLAKHGLEDNDSARLVAAGLPFDPASVSLVTDSATCQAIIDSYNATNSPHVSGGYVVSAGFAFVLFVPPKEVAYFDSTRRYLFSQWTLN